MTQPTQKMLPPSPFPDLNLYATFLGRQAFTDNLH